MALLKKISDKNQNLLRASTYINSFKRVVEELVYNSLDADSTSIAIRVCIENKYIQVLDNGIGISKENFRLLGDKYVTSKFVDDSSLKSTSKEYGYKGISLASIIEVSEHVKISSKFKNSQETWMKMFFKGSVEEFILTTSRPSKGTTVEISGFLYNLNIQRKSIDLLNEISNIKLALEQLSLVHCNVSFSLRDDSKNEIIFKIHKNRNIYQTLWSLFEINRNDLKDLQVEKNQYKVKAYIGKDCLVLKKKQWVFLNGRFISKSFLHITINEMFTKKNFNKTKVKFTDENNFNSKIPFYFIFMMCPYYDYDFNYNQKQTFVEFKNCEEVNNLIKKLINLYYGDIKLKPLVVREEIDEDNSNDTRKKVKEIMDKILNKNEKNANITQLQNGIKGKNIKRNVKKKNIMNNKEQNILKKKTIYNSLCKTKQQLTINGIDKNLNNETLFESHKSETNLIKNHRLHINYLNNNNTRNLSRKEKKSTKPKYNTKKIIKSCHAWDEPLLKKFEEQTKTVKKRCQTLSSEVQRILSRKYFKNIKMHNPNEKQGLDFHINSRNEVREKKTKQQYIKSNIVDHTRTKQVKTTYDLLKTNENKEKLPNDLFTDTQNNFIEESIESYKNIVSTYNSHSNREIFQKSSTRKSHNYLYHLNPILNPSSYTDKNQIQKKPNKLNWLKSAISTEYDNHYDGYTSLLHYKNVMRQNNLTFNESGNFHNITNSLNSKISLNDTNLTFENTYTINILNSLYSVNDGVNKTYSVKMSTNLSLSNRIINTSTSIEDTVPSKELTRIENEASIFTTKSQNNEEIEPLKFCEAILNSTEMRDIEQEFDKSFSNYEKINLITKSNNNCTRFYFDDVEGNEFVNSYKHKEQKDGFTLNCVKNNIANVEWSDGKLDNEAPSLPIFNGQAYDKDFKLKSRHNFVPKGMSQIFEGKLKKNTDHVNNDDVEYYEDAIYNHFAEDVHDKFEIFEPNVKNVKDIVSKDLNKVNERINKDNADLIFNSESLKQAQILGQVDKKFIAAKMQSRYSSGGKSSDFLILFDQHAVDERVKLERNLSDYFDGSRWKSVAFETFQLKLNHDEYFYLYNYKDKFSQFGLQWTFAEKYVLIHAVPEAILGKNPRKAEIIFTAIKNLISEQIEEIQSSRGNVSSYPKCLMELIFSEACRYAIMFGDQLSKDDCVNIIGALANCKTPFQCAHGRPVMAIIMEIPNNNLTYKVNLNSLKEFKKRMS